MVMGPSGCGKSTVGREAARLSGAAFVEADDHHDDAARAKMARGEGLTDDERTPWIARVADAANDAPSDRVVIACSALNGRVRREIGDRLQCSVRFALLDVPPEILARRLAARTGHFAGPSLLQSQLRGLQGGDVTRLDGTAPPEVLARQVAGLL